MDEHSFALNCIIYLDFRVCELFLEVKKYKKKLCYQKTASDVGFCLGGVFFVVGGVSFCFLV